MREAQRENDRPENDLSGTSIASELPAPGDIALFLDFDGTLVEIAPRPDAVELAPEIGEVLGALDARAQGRVAIVSGRRPADLERIMPDYRGVLVGDDQTDKDMFDAVNAGGGYGMKVGEGDTAAQLRLNDVAGVHDLLRSWLARAEKSS